MAGKGKRGVGISDGKGVAVAKAGIEASSRELAAGRKCRLRRDHQAHLIPPGDVGAPPIVLGTDGTVTARSPYILT